VSHRSRRRYIWQGDLGDVWVLEQELDRTHPDDRIRDLVDDLRERALREDVTVLAQHGQRFLTDAHPSLRG
jgi:hypothetical protein